MQGIYVLVIHLSEEIALSIGSLGKKSFTEGYYAYVGSAQKSLEKRVLRHLRKEKNLFWHIDRFLNNDFAVIGKVFYKPAKKTGECEVASILSRFGEPILGFGCSDCHCRSHLFRFPNEEQLLDSLSGMQLFSN